MANPPTSTEPAAPADTRSTIDRAIEQRLAETKFRDLVVAEMNHSGRTHEAAKGGVRSKHPRLVAVKDGDWQLDAKLAAAGHPEAHPELQD